MRLIGKLEIEGFRSLVDTPVEPLGNLSCLIGTNNSGKSNILRALHLFFTGAPEPGTRFDLSRDYHTDPKSRKKKRVRVAVSFSLPDYFRFRRGLEDVEKQLGKKFTIRKTWTLYQPEADMEVSTDGSKFRSISPPTVKQFTDLINFRYIHNRTVPAIVLRNEITAFQAYLQRRLKLKLKQQNITSTDILEAISQVAKDAMTDASASLSASTDSMKQLEITTSQGLANLAQVLGFSAEIQTGGKVSDEFWGSGTQAYMMFHLLKMVDTDFGSHFGWRQAAVWAIEEPESSLHKDLEQKLAVVLRGWADSATDRMQILTTTHSEVFTTVAGEAFMVELENGHSIVSHRDIPSLVHKAASLGISGRVEPALCFLLDPVILVEGAIDKMVLSHIAETTGVASECKFLSLSELDLTEHSGADNIIKYLKNYSGLIRNRPQNAPLIVLFDWDITSDKLTKARANYGEYGDWHVQCMDTSYADSRISPVIKGIERFYPPELFMLARDKNLADIAIDQNGIISIEKEKQHQYKSALANLMCQTDNKEWYSNLRKVLQNIQRIARTKPGEKIALPVAPS